VSVDTKFVFVSERTFEPWDWTNPDRVGIGGSETSHIEMAQRIARRGNGVISYAPLTIDETAPKGFAAPAPAVDTDIPEFIGPAGVQWRPIELFESAGSAGVLQHVPGLVYVIYRSPRLIDLVPAGAIAWLICQDVDYTTPSNCLTEERALRFTRIVALCQAQADHLCKRLPAAADRVRVSSNGVKAEYIRELLANPPERNPMRLIYASSPDRGLENLLQIFSRVREIVPAAELHVCYGFDNIEKVIARVGLNSAAARTYQRLQLALQAPGVFHYGRLGQLELLREWFKSSIWCHPSNFTETSCITCMDAQACGAVPVTRPIWAVGENVSDGVFIEGDATSELIRARYVWNVAELLLNPSIAEEHREMMMPKALHHFGWERWVDQWLDWAQADKLAAAMPAARRGYYTSELRAFREAGADLCEGVQS
jgi:glycosyltransferase involved in cell wall biosynthesis